MTEKYKALCITQVPNPQVYKVAGNAHVQVGAAYALKDKLPARITESIALVSLAGPNTTVMGHGWMVNQPPYATYYIRLHDASDIMGLVWAISQTPQTEDIWLRPPKPRSSPASSPNSNDCAPTISTP